MAHSPLPGAVDASFAADPELPEELLPDEPPDELPELDPEEPLPESPGGFPPASVAVPPSLVGPVQHSSFAGPGQNPGVETWPGIAAQSAVKMHTPAPTPGTVHDGAPEPESALDPPPSTGSLP